MLSLQAEVQTVDIDLANKPPWLSKFSPHLKVPVSDRTVLRNLEPSIARIRNNIEILTDCSAHY